MLNDKIIYPNKEIDLVLSGSGVRLGCHYGAVLALKKTNHVIRRIAGTSGGAIIAAAYACHYPFENVQKIIENINFNDIMCDSKYISWIRLIKDGGLYPGNKLEKFIDEKITFGLNMSNVPELSIIVSDITNGIPLVINDNNGYGYLRVSQAIRMSMSAPIYWVPKHLFYNNEYVTVVDGGVVANYYIDLFDDNERPTIGILLYNKKKKSKIKVINYFKNIINSMMMANEQEHIEDAYWSKTIKIDTEDISPFDLDITPDQVGNLVKIGYDTTLEVLKNKIEKSEES